MFLGSPVGQVAWCFVILLPATVQLGLTLPLMVEALTVGAAATAGGARSRNTDEHPRLAFAAPVSHRARQTLSRPVMRGYFDRILARLPAGVRFGGELGGRVGDADRRRATHRQSLLGDVKP